MKFSPAAVDDAMYGPRPSSPSGTQFPIMVAQQIEPNRSPSLKSLAQPRVENVSPTTSPTRPGSDLVDEINPTSDKPQHVCQQDDTIVKDIKECFSQELLSYSNRMTDDHLSPSKLSDPDKEYVEEVVKWSRVGREKTPEELAEVSVRQQKSMFTSCKNPQSSGIEADMASTVSTVTPPGLHYGGQTGWINKFAKAPKRFEGPIGLDRIACLQELKREKMKAKSLKNMGISDIILSSAEFEAILDEYADKNEEPIVDYKTQRKQEKQARVDALTEERIQNLQAAKAIREMARYMRVCNDVRKIDTNDKAKKVHHAFVYKANADILSADHFRSTEVTLPELNKKWREQITLEVTKAVEQHMADSKPSADDTACLPENPKPATEDHCSTHEVCSPKNDDSNPSAKERVPSTHACKPDTKLKDTTYRMQKHPIACHPGNYSRNERQEIANTYRKQVRNRYAQGPLTKEYMDMNDDLGKKIASGVAHTVSPTQPRRCDLCHEPIDTVPFRPQLKPPPSMRKKAAPTKRKEPARNVSRQFTPLPGYTSCEKTIDPVKKTVTVTTERPCTPYELHNYRNGGRSTCRTSKHKNQRWITNSCKKKKNSRAWQPRPKTTSKPTQFAYATATTSSASTDSHDSMPPLVS